jgi:hypothetical protein
MATMETNRNKWQQWKQIETNRNEQKQVGRSGNK